MWIDVYDEVPKPEANLVKRRRTWKLFGLRLTWTEYTRAVRPTSGAPIGITSSRWLYTRTWAYGRGIVYDWAMLQNLEIKVGPCPPIVSEAGVFDLTPPLVIPQTFELRLHNRNTVDAAGVLICYELDGSAEYERARAHFSVLAHAQKLYSIRAEKPFVIRRVRCFTERAVAWRKARIYGRPEWQD